MADHHSHRLPLDLEPKDPNFRRQCLAWSWATRNKRRVVFAGGLGVGAVPAKVTRHHSAPNLLCCDTPVVTGGAFPPHWGRQLAALFFTGTA